MESKRQSQKDGDERGEQKWRREDSQLSETIRYIIGNYRSLHIWTGELFKMPHFADCVGKLVREELERQLARQSNNETGKSGTKPLQLVFKKELPATIFTKSKIKAKDDTCVEIALYDAKSRCIVAEGSLSSMKIEICVLNGEFGSNGSEDWSTAEFTAKILRQRDNKGLLLKGDRVITLTNGVGYISNLDFTDNSRWIRTGHFRLGAKPVQSNLTDAISVREGRSNPFIVRERNQKHDTPSLRDPIWRLKHISTKGPSFHQLSDLYGINTVGDLLKEHETNPLSLQEKFGKIPKRKQEEIIKHAQKAKHAKTCVTEITFDGQNYHSEKNILNSYKKESYKNMKDLSLETIKHDSVKTLIQYGPPTQDLQNTGFPIAQEEIYRLMEPPNGSGWGKFADGNIWPVEASQFDHNAICSTAPDIIPYYFPMLDEAECSNHPSFPNSSLYTSNKGKGKML
ncbi:hypothetical protein VNO78_18298 [Psophocarpus tetragonolobus]|uniref:Calmodulin-binding protein n=1 Tax=Psophocarpus tetragonolobus TaxID=3891 RepID=A0AAN9SJK5_PSOTE